MTASLVFRQSAATSGRMRFGVVGNDTDERVTASLIFRKPATTSGRMLFAPTGGGSPEPIIPPVDLTLDGYFPAVEFSCLLEYRSDTQRPLVSRVRGGWQQAISNPTGTAQSMQDASKHPAGWQPLWRKAIDAGVLLHMLQPKVLQPDRQGVAGIYQLALRLQASAGVQSQSGLPQHVRYTGGYEVAVSDRLRVGFKHQDGLRDRRPEHTGRTQVALPWQVGLGTDFQRAVSAPTFWVSRFQPAMQPPVGTSYPPGPPIDPPDGDKCYTPDPHLIFTDGRALNGHLVFICGRAEPQASVVVPIKEVYLTINSAILVRLDNGHVIPTTAMAMSIDADSWTWSFSATVPGHALASVQSGTNGDPVVVQATINGINYRFIVEKVARDRTFNSSQLRINGRGLSAELDSPYSPVQFFGNSSDQTARQLLDSILTVNGVPISWSISSFDIDDWLVPSGVFSHQGSYISALNAVVGSVGGYLQPHNTERTMSAALKYPTPAWQWGEVTPMFELPAAVTTQEGFEWLDKPNYNRVYVSGQEGGVLGQYTRVGTAGDLVAPQVVDPLITHAVAARQRGRAVLSDTGRIAAVTLRLPVLAETGIIKPGNFVQYKEGGNTHVGLTRGVSVAVGLPTIYQTITLETHLEPV